MGYFKNYTAVTVLNLDSVIVIQRRDRIASAALTLFIIPPGPFRRDCSVSHRRPSAVTYMKDRH